MQPFYILANTALEWVFGLIAQFRPGPINAEDHRLGPHGTWVGWIVRLGDFQPGEQSSQDLGALGQAYRTISGHVKN